MASGAQAHFFAHGTSFRLKTTPWSVQSTRSVEEKACQSTHARIMPRRVTTGVRSWILLHNPRPDPRARLRASTEGNMLKGFRDFLMRGNVVELAAAVIIGVAFNGVVDGLIKGIIDPLIAVLAPGDVQPLQSALLLGPVKIGLVLSAR